MIMSIAKDRKSNNNLPELDNELREILEIKKQEILKMVKNNDEGKDIEEPTEEID
jgi:hypothetical protein